MYKGPRAKDKNKLSKAVAIKIKCEMTLKSGRLAKIKSKEKLKRETNKPTPAIIKTFSGEPIKSTPKSIL
jgi:hypothetical protein